MTDIIAFDMPDTTAFDRYRVVFVDEDEGEWALTIGPTGNVPNGVCMTTEHVSTDPYPGEVPIEVESLPAPVRKAIDNELRLLDDYLKPNFKLDKF